MIFKIILYFRKLYEYIFYLGYQLFDEIYSDHINKITYSVALLYFIVLYIVAIPIIFFLIKEDISIHFGYWVVASILFMFLNSFYFSKNKCEEIKAFYSKGQNSKYKYGIISLFVISSLFWFIPK